MAYISPRDSAIMSEMSFDQRVTTLAAAYTLYAEMSAKKPLTPREFYQRYRDNWDIFLKFETEERGVI